MPVHMAPMPGVAFSIENRWGGRDWVRFDESRIRTIVTDLDEQTFVPATAAELARGVGPDHAHCLMGIVKFSPGVAMLREWRVDLAHVPVAVRLAVLQAALEATR